MSFMSFLSKNNSYYSVCTWTYLMLETNWKLSLELISLSTTFSSSFHLKLKVMNYKWLELLTGHTFFFWGGGGGVVLLLYCLFSHSGADNLFLSNWSPETGVHLKSQPIGWQEDASPNASTHCPPIQPLNTSKLLQKLHINSWWTMVNLKIIKNSLFLNNSFNVFSSCLALNSLKTWQMKSFKNECFLHFCIHTKDRSCPRLYHK